MLWATFGTLASKFASLAAQLVLGWVLSKEDFALYAIAISWSTIVLALRNGGTQRLLIQQGSKYEECAPVFFKIALIFIAAIVVSSLFSRVWRSTELRVENVELDDMAREGFMARAHRDMVLGEEDTEELLRRLSAYEAPVRPRWGVRTRRASPFPYHLPGTRCQIITS